MVNTRACWSLLAKPAKVPDLRLSTKPLSWKTISSWKTMSVNYPWRNREARALPVKRGPYPWWDREIGRLLHLEHIAYILCSVWVLCDPQIEFGIKSDTYRWFCKQFKPLQVQSCLERLLCHQWVAGSAVSAKFDVHFANRCLVDWCPTQILKTN